MTLEQIKPAGIIKIRIMVYVIWYNWKKAKIIKCDRRLIGKNKLKKTKQKQKQRKQTKTEI